MTNTNRITPFFDAQNRLVWPFVPLFDEIVSPIQNDEEPAIGKILNQPEIIAIVSEEFVDTNSFTKRDLYVDKADLQLPALDKSFIATVLG